ncbi:DUF6232 family protein [Myceligenerans pegani]|uniref:Uncharacterized protein n=1 Tax=Myceligenerans pegani TaxID=2776917 RepID=A0ABR9N390_9MICO|nr:DUF6232 family protein [Myceligenerans sp. TRM 65318]MBE1878127.1 hypothetical protein [Myceligenerans sp. TRM 65318]MBE3020398.1 hypothetical protein [Myceligenerans sp. TRM 65318]
MAAFWKLEGLKETTWTPRVHRGILTVSGIMFPLGNLERARIHRIGKPRRRMPGGWPGQAAGVVLLVALAWACFLLFGVLEPLFWVGPALLVVAAGALLAYGMRGAPCPPFACLEIESSTGYVVRVFSLNKNGELERLRDAVGHGHHDKEHEFSEEMRLLTNAQDFCDLGGAPDKVDVVR